MLIIVKIDVFFILHNNFCFSCKQVKKMSIDEENSDNDNNKMSSIDDEENSDNNQNYKSGESIIIDGVTGMIVEVSEKFITVFTEKKKKYC